MKNFKVVKKLISKVLRVSEDKITINSKNTDFNNWDSLALVRITLEIEKKFKIKIAPRNLNKLNSVKSILKLL